MSNFHHDHDYHHHHHGGDHPVDLFSMSLLTAAMAGSCQDRIGRQESTTMMMMIWMMIMMIVIMIMIVMIMMKSFQT